MGEYFRRGSCKIPETSDFFSTKPLNKEERPSFGLSFNTTVGVPSSNEYSSFQDIYDESCISKKTSEYR